MIISGSTAIKQYIPEFREPKDVDVFCTEDEVFDFRVDKIVIPKDLYDTLPYQNIEGNQYLTLDALYTIKLSHLTWNKNDWQKHKSDVLVLKTKYNCNLIINLYCDFVNFWSKDTQNKNFLNLKQSKEDFFTDNVTYTYDHDYLHELVSYPKEPLYKKVLKEGEEVLVDKYKFLLLPLTDQVELFRQEINTIALERWYLTDYWKKRNITFQQSYSLALEKTVTNLTKGWATDFILFNLEYFCLPDINIANKVIQLLDLEEKYMSKVDMTIFEEILKDTDLVEEGTDLDYLLGELCEDDLDFALYDGSYENYQQNKETFKEKYNYEHLDSDGGGEGGSEYYYGIFKLGGKIYKAEYNYYPYSGYSYDGILSTLKEVTPKQITITVYE